MHASVDGSVSFPQIFEFEMNKIDDRRGYACDCSNDVGSSIAAIREIANEVAVVLHLRLAKLVSLHPITVQAAPNYGCGLFRRGFGLQVG
jgi:hypothetical protein